MTIGSAPLMADSQTTQQYYNASAPEYDENKIVEQDLTIYTQYVSELDGRAKSSTINIFRIHSFASIPHQGLFYCFIAAVLDNYVNMH